MLCEMSSMSITLHYQSCHLLQFGAFIISGLNKLCLENDRYGNNAEVNDVIGFVVISAIDNQL